MFHKSKLVHLRKGSKSPSFANWQHEEARLSIYNKIKNPEQEDWGLFLGDDLIVVDLDVSTEFPREADVLELCETRVVKTTEKTLGSMKVRGLHLYYKRPSDSPIVSKKIKICRMWGYDVDLLTGACYVVLPNNKYIVYRDIEPIEFGSDALSRELLKFIIKKRPNNEFYEIKTEKHSLYISFKRKVTRGHRNTIFAEICGHICKYLNSNSLKDCMFELMQNNFENFEEYLKEHNLQREIESISKNESVDEIYYYICLNNEVYIFNKHTKVLNTLPRLLIDKNYKDKVLYSSNGSLFLKNSDEYLKISDKQLRDCISLDLKKAYVDFSQGSINDLTTAVFTTLLIRKQNEPVLDYDNKQNALGPFLLDGSRNSEFIKFKKNLSFPERLEYDNSKEYLFNDLFLDILEETPTSQQNYFMQQIAKYLWNTTDLDSRVIFVLLGTGGNGKSTLFDVLITCFGEYVSSLPPSAFQVGASRFSLHDLKYSRINCTSELPSRNINIELIKNLSGEGILDIETKYKQSERITKRVLQIFAMNEWNRKFSDSESLRDRFIVIELKTNFRQKQNTRVSNFLRNLNLEPTPENIKNYIEKHEKGAIFEYFRQLALKKCVTRPSYIDPNRIESEQRTKWLEAIEHFVDQNLTESCDNLEFSRVGEILRKIAITRNLEYNRNTVYSLLTDVLNSKGIKHGLVQNRRCILNKQLLLKGGEKL